MNKAVTKRVAMHGTGREYLRRLSADIRRDRWLYALLVPGVVYFLVFKYLPMWGVVMAFENYVPFSGVFGSEWVGMKWFGYFFLSPAWTRYLANTLVLSLMNIVFYFPAPIILALLLNEMQSLRYKKVLQTLLYVPHFISIVIVVSITFVIFGSSGIIYRLTEKMLGQPIKYLSDPGVFRWMIIGQTVWKETGWGTIIFLAALTNVDVQLYEAAMVDGAGRLRRLWHITLPAIRSTIVLMLILRMGSIMSNGFEQIYTLQNTQNLAVSEVFETYTYRVGLLGGRFSFATTVGLFASVISMIFLLTTNFISKKMGEETIF